MKNLLDITNLPPDKMALTLVLLALPILPNLWSLWHAFHRDFATSQEKMLWVGVCIFVPVLGGLAYFFFGRRRALKAPPAQDQEPKA